MTLLGFAWKPRQARSPAELRLAKFQALLGAAHKTRHYRPLLEALSLARAEETVCAGCIEETLARLPRAELSTLRRDPDAFLNRKARPVRQRLFYPQPPASKTAVLGAGFKRQSGIKVFEQVSRRKLVRYRPDAIAGPVEVLRRLAEAAEDRGACVPRIGHSVIAFMTPLHTFLSDEARELLWRVFRVPVFGQMLGLDAELLAWECEAHDGFHIHTEQAVFELAAGGGEPELLITSLANLRRPTLRLATGLTAWIERSTCGCGQTVPRLLGLRRRSLESAAAAKQAAGGGSCAAA